MLGVCARIDRIRGWLRTAERIDVIAPLCRILLVRSPVVAGAMVEDAKDAETVEAVALLENKPPSPSTADREDSMEGDDKKARNCEDICG